MAAGFGEKPQQVNLAAQEGMELFILEIAQPKAQHPYQEVVDVVAPYGPFG